MFAWLPVLGVDVIDSLQPFSTLKVAEARTLHSLA